MVPKTIPHVIKRGAPGKVLVHALHPSQWKLGSLIWLNEQITLDFGSSKYIYFNGLNY